MCTHSYKGTPEIGERWGSALIGIGLTPWKQAPPTSNLVVLRQRMYAEIEGNPQNWTALGHRPPCSWIVSDTIEMCPFTHVLILLPDQTVRELLSKSALKNVTHRVPPFKVTQGHQNRHGSIRHILWLSTNISYQPWAYLVPFLCKRRFQLKINFYTPSI